MSWDPLPLARAILADSYAPPAALLAAWSCLYHGDCARLTSIAYQAAGLPEPAALSPVGGPNTGKGER